MYHFFVRSLHTSFGKNENPRHERQPESEKKTPYIVKAWVFNKLKHSWTQLPNILHQKTGRFCSWLKGMHQWLLEWSWQNQEEKKRNIKTGRAHRNAIQVREATSQKSNKKWQQGRRVGRAFQGWHCERGTNWRDFCPLHTYNLLNTLNDLLLMYMFLIKQKQ